jgi:hypothetical protein
MTQLIVHIPKDKVKAVKIVLKAMDVPFEKMKKKKVGKEDKKK